jgi:hypothetical protein
MHPPMRQITIELINWISLSKAVTPLKEIYEERRRRSFSYMVSNESNKILLSIEVAYLDMIQTNSCSTSELFIRLSVLLVKTILVSTIGSIGKGPLPQGSMISSINLPMTMYRSQR